MRIAIVICAWFLGACAAQPYQLRPYVRGDELTKLAVITECHLQETKRECRIRGIEVNGELQAQYGQDGPSPKLVFDAWCHRWECDR